MLRRLLHTAAIFLRRRVHVSYWVILLVVLLEWLLRTHWKQIDLRTVASRRLRALQSEYDAPRNSRDWDLQVGDFTLEEYTADLQAAWDSLFGTGSPSSRRSPHPIPWDSLSTRLALEAKPTFGQRIPHRVWTTSSVPPSQYPEQFRYWAQNDHSLTFRHLNDTIMDQYLSTIYPEGSPMSQVLKALPKQVLKADILRYTLLLHKGGIYSDTDTAAVRKFEDWGADYIDLTDSLIAQIPRLLNGDASLSNNLPPPALIVSIEIDGSEGDWRDKTLARGLQIVQWTIAAQAGHPVFLDVLSKVVQKWKEATKKGENLEEVDVLQWTGPGPWTDAVIRYLLARHGSDPRQWAQADVPVRIGEVLILPSHSFQADASEGDQPAYACVWHGFYGSWKEPKEESGDVKKEEHIPSADFARD